MEPTFLLYLLSDCFAELLLCSKIENFEKY